MRTTRPLFEGEKRHSVSVSLPLMMQALRDVLPRSAAALIDVEWDGKNDSINFYYETEQDRESVENHNKHLRNRATETYCDCKSCEIDRDYEKRKTGTLKPDDHNRQAGRYGACGCGHCTGDR